MGGDGAQASQRPSPEQEEKQEQKQSEKHIYISVAFSALSFDEVVTYQKREDDDSEVQSLSQLSEVLSEYGSVDRDTFDDSIFVDCSDVIMPINEILEEYEEAMLERFDNVLGFLKRRLIPKRDEEKITAHLYVACTSGAEDLGYALAYVCEKKMGDKIENNTIKGTVNNEYSSFFDYFTTNDNEIKIDYLGIVDWTIGYIAR